MDFTGILKKMRFLATILTVGAFAGSLTVEALPEASGQPFLFREPELRAYRLAPQATANAAGDQAPRWIEAETAARRGSMVEFGSRVVLQLKSRADLPQLLANGALRQVREVTANLFILEAPDAWQAAAAAARYSQDPRVLAAYPVRRKRLIKAWPLAPRPNDSYFSQQWNLENRQANGVPQGVDLNARGAWPLSRGQGVCIAIVDDGVELTHPDLAGRLAGMPHYNFDLMIANGGPAGPSANHSTAVAGLAAAEGNNRRGITGVAPAASLASLVIFRANDTSVEEEALQTMFQYRLEVVQVQNHSWISSSGFLSGPTLLEEVGISNAISQGRSGRGTILVRAAGNGRQYGDNANDDGYVSDPRAIAVGAIRSDGKITTYSNPGACLLVAAPAGDDGFPAMLTTDRQGTLGHNTGTYTNDQADYYDSFTGTSSTAPQLAGLAALMLSANTNLTWRDVQQVLILSAQQRDPSDPHLQVNGAGFSVSQNTGFGVPDAGQSVRLAARWPNRPPLTEIRYTNNTVSAIPEEGLRVAVSGTNVPAALQFIPALPAALGPRADKPTPRLPLTFVGQALNPLTNDLAGQGALIQRGVNFFSDKIAYASQAGAPFAVIFNNTGGTDRVTMDVPDDVPIPAVFISQNDGEALLGLIQTNPTVTARLQLNAAAYNFSVTPTLLCEHVAVRLRTSHSRRGDLRITLQSPAGTVSVLQKISPDNAPGPTDWTYYSTHHFYESSRGPWTLQVSDEVVADTGSVLEAELIVRGVAITDQNNDGLDDQWTLQSLQTTTADPKADADGDGYSNIREYLLGTDPRVPNYPLELDFSFLDRSIGRLSWPGNTNRVYQISTTSNLGQPFTVLTNVTGKFPETEWLRPNANASGQFFKVTAMPPP